MKNFSLLKLGIALFICNIFIFCCAVTGTVSSEIPSELPQDSETESDPPNKLGGTIDFIDENITADNESGTSGDNNTTSVDENTSTVILENLGFAKPTLTQKPLGSLYRPTSSVLKLTQKEPDNSQPEESTSTDANSSSNNSSSSEPEISEPSVTEPDTPEPDTSEPDTPEPDTPEPDTPEPDISEPDTPEPDTPEPDTPEPDTPEPDTPEPDTPEPDIPESNTSEPDTPSQSEPNSTPVSIPDEPDEPVGSGSENTSGSEVPPDIDPDAEILRVNNDGTEVSGNAVDIITQIVENEIGSTFAPEAIKAQAVTAYTYVKYSNLHGTSPYCVLRESTNDSVRTLVQSVIGQGIYYDGELIQAVYSASSAGSTASSQNVWGGYLPYLQGVYCELDEKYDPNYGRKVTFSESEMKSRIYDNANITLSGDPASWFIIENRTEGKYVGDMKIGGQDYFIDKDGDTLKATGRRFREIIMDYDIRSSAFDIDYDPDTQEFTITTYGYGHGVGLSQNGANNLAKYWGWDYKKILTFYFQGTEVY